MADPIVYWAGSEDADFLNGGLVFVRTDAGSFDSNLVRCSLAGALYNYPHSDLFEVGQLTTCWFSFWAYWNGNTSYGDYINPLAGLVKGAYNPRGLWIWRSSTTDLQLRKYVDETTGWVTLGTSTSGVFTSGLHKIDVQLTSYGASGNVKVHINRNPTPAIDYTGDLTSTSVSGVDAVGICAYYGSYWCRMTISEPLVSDSDTRLMRVRTMYDDAAGDSNAWGGAYTDVNELNIDLDTYIYTDSDAQDYLANVLDVPASPTYVVRGVRRMVRAARMFESNVGAIKLGIKSGGTINVDSTEDELENAWGTYQHMMQVNPVTGNPFTISELNSLQSVIRSVATPSASVSPSASISPSASASPSISPSASASASVSPSSSASPST